MDDKQLRRIQRNSRDRDAIRSVLLELREERKKEEKTRQPRKLALIVEDDPMTKLWVRRLLESENFAVMTASSAADCMHALQIALPDIIILDLMIPDANGDEIFEKLRQSPRTMTVPVVFMSGMISMHEELTLNNSEKPLEAYLSKPFEGAKLIQFVNLLLSNSKK